MYGLEPILGERVRRSKAILKPTIHLLGSIHRMIFVNVDLEVDFTLCGIYYAELNVSVSP